MMSVFRVKLNNTEQGLMDLDPATAVANVATGTGLGAQMGDSASGSSQSSSLQRSVYVMGPNKINRLLKDGDQFTDCNYWKRFAYPQVPLNEAIVEVVTDDGSVYSDIAAENVYPQVDDLSVAAASTYAANEIDFAGAIAVFVQITNNHGSQGVKIRLNGATTATFDLAFGDTQVFNAGDLTITKIQVDNSDSGAVGPVPVQVISSIRSVCTS